MNPYCVDIGPRITDWSSVKKKLTDALNTDVFRVDEQERILWVHCAFLEEVCGILGLGLQVVEAEYKKLQRRFSDLSGPGVVNDTRVSILRRQLLLFDKLLLTEPHSSLRYRMLEAERQLLQSELTACLEFLSKVQMRCWNVPVSSR